MVYLQFGLAALFATIIVKTSFSYSISIASESRECYILSAGTGSVVSGSFEVITGEPTQVKVTVTGPAPNHFLHYESKFLDGPDADKDLSEGEFSFAANKAGDYQMCLLSNDEVGTDGLPATVAFNFRVLASGEKDYEYKGLETELNELKQGLNSLKDHEAYMNQREDVHKITLDSINSKVIFWTVVEALILVAMALWQVTYISNFFETKRKM